LSGSSRTVSGAGARYTYHSMLSFPERLGMVLSHTAALGLKVTAEVHS
jgi:hypothetical protein